MAKGRTVRRVLLAVLAVVALLVTGCGPEEGRDLSDFATGALADPAGIVR